jgi:hypothetical protein
VAVGFADGAGWRTGSGGSVFHCAVDSPAVMAAS